MVGKLGLVERVLLGENPVGVLEVLDKKMEVDTGLYEC